jgi:hypothetical protein
VPTFTGEQQQQPSHDRRAIGVPLTMAISGQLRLPPATRTPRSESMTSGCGQPSKLTVPLRHCLRRGLRLKDGPGSARAATVSVWLRWGFTHGAKPATRRVADGERMNLPGKGGASAPIQETTSTGGGEHLENGRTPGAAAPDPACMAPVAPLFHPLPSCADAAGSSLHQRGDPAPRVRAISGH